MINQNSILTQICFSSYSLRFNTLYQNSNLWTNLFILRPLTSQRISTGILTCLPSATSFDLTLGPDLTFTDEPCKGTLRFSGHWILTSVFVTQANSLAF